MAHHELHDKALDLRMQGMSYSQIKEELGISKSTLSGWLKEYPLSREQINELRGNNEKRIERYRETRAKSRAKKQTETYEKVATEINTISNRELFLAGFFLYWAEGTKANRGSVLMTNTDPKMLEFFIKWLELMGIERSKIKGYLHLYEDMDIEKETKFWADTLLIPVANFRKPYIKESFTDKHKNYKGRFGHGTCNIIVNDVKLYDKIMNGIEYIRAIYGTIGLRPKLAV